MWGVCFGSIYDSGQSSEDKLTRCWRWYNLEIHSINFTSLPSDVGHIWYIAWRCIMSSPMRYNREITEAKSYFRDTLGPKSAVKSHTKRNAEKSLVCGKKQFCVVHQNLGWWRSPSLLVLIPNGKNVQLPFHCVTCPLTRNWPLHQNKKMWGIQRCWHCIGAYIIYIMQYLSFSYVLSFFLLLFFWIIVLHSVWQNLYDITSVTLVIIKKHLQQRHYSMHMHKNLMRWHEWH